jgi:hypothetical protein
VKEKLYGRAQRWNIRGEGKGGEERKEEGNGKGIG